MSRVWKILILVWVSQGTFAVEPDAAATATLKLMVDAHREVLETVQSSQSPVEVYESPRDRSYRCAVEAANRFEVDVLLLMAIKGVESGSAMTGRIELINRNDDGSVASVDRGPMQVNSQWLPKLRKLGVVLSEEDLYDWCVSFNVGAWLLSDLIDRHGVAEGVARYHSPTGWRGARYVRAVLKKLERMAVRVNG
jgi:soluble lytic murein transglycosylase-like protein